MNNSNRLYINVLLAIAAPVFLYSCVGNNSPDSKTSNANNKPEAGSHKGKTIDKENSLTKPLTLTESHIPGKVKYISYRKYYLRTWHGTVIKKLVFAKGYYSYDTSGHLLCHNEFNADGTPLIACMYNYDKQNRPADWDIMDGDIGRQSKIVFKYDDKGYKTEVIIDDKDPRFSTKAKFKYDENGNEIAEYDYAEGDKLKGEITSKYDNKGNQVELDYRSFDKAILSKTACTYDDNGNEISGKKYKLDTEVISQWVCKNDQNGKCVERAYYAPYSSVVLRNDCKYDGHGNILEFNYYKPDGSLNEDDSYSYQYVYDKTGNVIKRTKLMMKNGRLTPVELTESEFEYY